MRKQALVKDFYMEIRNSLNRFISIFFIVALGVAFFSGVRAAEPDMRYSGDEYFDERNMMDLKVLSTLGLNEDDIQAIQQVEGVDKVEPGYMVDVLSLIGDKEYIIHVESLPETMNQVDILEGRLPQKIGECVLDIDMAESAGIQIGDVLTFRSGNEDELSDTLSDVKYEVVGLCSSPMYISFSRGSTNIGNGEINMFAYVTDDSFCQEVYSQAYVTVAGAKAVTAFTEEYQSLVEDVQEKIEHISDNRCEVRYEEIMDEANEAISEAESELESAKEEVNENLAEAEEELIDGEAALASGRAELVVAEAEISSTEVSLAEGEKEIKDAEKALAEAEKELVTGEAAIAEAEQVFSEKEAELLQAEQGLADAKALIAGLETGWQEYQGGMSGLETIKNQLRLLDEAIASGTATNEQIEQAEQLRTLKTQTENQLTQARAQLEAMEAMRPQAEIAIANEAQIVASRQEFNAGKEELEANKEELVSGRAALEAGKAELEANKSNITTGWVALEAGKAQILEGYAEIEENARKLADGWKEYEEGKREAEAEIFDAEVKLQDAKSEIEGIEPPSWYVNDREDDTEYLGYSENAERMGAIGKVFPLIFFLVAALVSLTTMTRMVEEQRMQIGTLKALGYSQLDIAAKFLGYALLATLGGSIVGVLIGEKVFPWIIVNAYKILYIHMPNVVIPYDFGYALMATVAAVACTMVATISSCHKALTAQPAALMRPEAPQVGKKVLLEYFPFIWVRLNFTWKSTVRNLLRYKKRFLMTVFGIGGCMALMLVGYGLKDSIMDVAYLQYGKVQIYDMMAIIDEDISDEDKTALNEELEADQRVEGFMDGYMRLTEMTVGAQKKDLYLYVPSTLEGLDQFINFSYRKSDENWYLDENSVVITEKVARDLGVEKGDEISLELKENQHFDVKITDICENYLAHYIYMAPQVYEQLVGEEADDNCIYVSVSEESMDELNEVGEEFLKHEGVLTVSYTNNMAQSLEDMLAVLDSVIIVLIVSAGMLAFVVLYNLNNININERKRELATLKVLGFYDGEVAAYVYRENVLLTIIGSAVGAVLGKILHQFVVRTVEVDQTMFGLDITMKSYLISIAFTVIFAIIVNGVMYFKLKKIDMVESLKSVE